MTDWAQYQRDLMLADLADEAVRGGDSLSSTDQNHLKLLQDRAKLLASVPGVDESFLPLDYMPEPEVPLDKVAIDNRTKIDLLKSYLDDVSKAESTLRQNSFLATQAHVADLTWIATELNGALMSWGDGDEDIHHVAARMRIRHLVKSIKAKTEVIK